MGLHEVVHSTLIDWFGAWPTYPDADEDVRIRALEQEVRDLRWRLHTTTRLADLRAGKIQKEGSG